jgi:hypothetical protein
MCEYVRDVERHSINKTYLVLDEELDTLDGSGSGLRDSGGDTTHYWLVSFNVRERKVFDMPSRTAEAVHGQHHVRMMESLE